MDAFSRTEVRTEEELDDILENRNLFYKLYKLVWIIIYGCAWAYFINNKPDSVRYEDVFLLTVLSTFVVFIIAAVAWGILSTIYNHYYVGNFWHKDIFVPLIQASVDNNCNYCEELNIMSDKYPEVDAYIKMVLNVRELFFGDYVVAYAISNDAYWAKEKEKNERVYRESCVKLHSRQ